ncbi:3-keto-disaccharide hydrolase [Spongiimicrobium salis]|uniref:3-keto-disaccharide hydrolase n=1 Tax=Spongiimicrobium salis TaxID=1667022 RepID=UPI00374D3E94
MTKLCSRIFGLLLCALLFFSCQEKQKPAVVVGGKTAEKAIVHEEYSGTEPTKPEETELYTPVPPTVTPATNTKIPSDAIALFDGTNFNEWISSQDSTAVDWHLNSDGSMTVKDKVGDIQTKREFGSIQLHLEWRSPAEINGKGQSRGNSGVFLQNRYEVQILDNNNNDTYVNGQVGSIYKQHIPLAKASVPSGAWNTYDIIFHAPVFNEAGEKTTSGTVTVLHNGILVQDHAVLKGSTEYIGWPKNEAHGKAPIRLQDHGDNSRVSYRNIWVREL